VTTRWLLHPVTAAVALTTGAILGYLGGTVLLLVVAGAAAGFASSGST
jgi:hypothetical protein